MPPALFLADTRQLDRGLGATYAALSRLAWFTDLDEPNADALGLTRNSTYCDRTAYRWQVVDGLGRDVRGLPPVPYGVIRARLNVYVRDGLELAPGAEPRRWWVATWPVPVTFAPARTDAREGVAR
jgi:hypothetical protein